MVVEGLNFSRHTWSPLVFAAYTTSWVNEFYKLTTSCAKQPSLQKGHRSGIILSAPANSWMSQLLLSWLVHGASRW